MRISKLHINETFTFLVKKKKTKSEKKQKILLLQRAREIVETTPLKLLFDLSRYLDSLPRYKDSKCL